MSKSDDNKGATGIGLCGAIFIVFLVLKLGAVASWSWWWVTSPLWIPTVIVLAAVAGFLTVKFIALAVIAPIVDRSNRRERMRRAADD